MPELPDIALYLEALSPRVLNQPLERVRVMNPFLVRTPEPPISSAEGRLVVALRRLGKRIVFVGTYMNSKTAEVLRLLDQDRLLVETDAPYLSPRPVRGERNVPRNVVHTARFVAERLGMEYEELATLTTRNARNLFGLPLEV